MSPLVLLATPTISLGPAALTYPELAKALTRAGMPTEPSMALHDRAVFVRLRGRSPEAVRRLLGEALGIVFHEDGPGRWRMVVDPEVRERDRLFLVAYRRQATEAARSWAAAQDRLRGGRDYEAMARWAETTEASLSGIDPVKGEPRLATFLAGAIQLRPERWTATSAARDSGQIGEAIGSFEPVRRTLRADWATRVFKRPIARVQTSLGYDPRSGTLTCQAFGLSSEGIQSWLPPYPGNTRMPGLFPEEDERRAIDIPAEGADLEETFARMGPAAKSYLRSLRANDPMPNTPVLARLKAYTLSNVLEGLDCETVLELSPRFERMWSHEGAKVWPLSLRSALTPASSPFWRNLDDALPTWIANLLSGKERTQEAWEERAYPWRPILRDGVWLVVNPVAFLDRAQWVSPVPYLTLERLQAQIPIDAPIGYQGQRLPTWDLAVEMGRTVPEDARLYWEYRGIKVDADLLRSARLLGVVPDEIWQRAAKDWTELSRADGMARVRLVRPEPQFAMRGRVAQVLVEWRGNDGTSGSWGGLVDGRGLVP